MDLYIRNVEQKIFKTAIYLAITISIITSLFYINSILQISHQVPLSNSAEEQKSPSNWIKENQILVKEEQVNLDIENATLTSYADTNSMDPVLDEYSNGIEIEPEKGEIEKGDIISYDSKIYDSIIVHRVMNIREDKKGTYYITKGDNNGSEDPEKVRFNQVEGVVVGLVY